MAALKCPGPVKAGLEEKKRAADGRAPAMATNFEITVVKNCDGIGLKLEGDFDATSAYELIYAIKKLPEGAGRLHIYTNALKTIHPFGLDVFHHFMHTLRGKSADFVFNGKHAFRLSETSPEV
jgi:hypothetical protein